MRIWIGCFYELSIFCLDGMVPKNIIFILLESDDYYIMEWGWKR